MTPDERLDRYARLAVEVAVNLQPGQFLRISADPEHLPLARAVGRVAYERGARFVDVHYRDAHLKRAMIEHAPDDALEWSPPDDRVDRLHGRDTRRDDRDHGRRRAGTARRPRPAAPSERGRGSPSRSS